MKKAVNIFEHTNCISEDMLVKYVSDKLSSAEKHEVEKHLVDCEMCSDAVEGLRMIGDPKRISAATSELNRKILERAGKKEMKVVFLRQYRTQLAVAASVAVIIGLVWFFRSSAPMQEMDSITAEKMFSDKFEPPAAETLEEAQAAPAEQGETEQADANNAATSYSSPTEQIISFKEDAEGAGNSIVAPEEPGMPAAPTSIEEKSIVYKDAKTQEYLKAADDELAKEVSQKNKSAVEPRKDEDKKTAQPSAIITSGTAYGATAPSQNTNTYTWSQNNGAAATTPAAPAPEGTYKVATSTTAGKKSRAKFRKTRSRSAAYGDYESARAPKAASKSDKSVGQAAADSTTSLYTKEESLSLSDVQIKDSAMLKYEKQDYAGAIVEFEEMLKKNPNDEKSLFYSAASYLSLGQTDKAITNLDKVLLNKSSKYGDDARWYLSLAYIKKKDAQNARTNLMELKNNSKSKYQKQAEETLKELGK